MNQNEYQQFVLRILDLMAAERARLAISGPHFVIVHRFWQPYTICTPGEVIADIILIHRRREVSIPLSTRLMLLFEYLARHTHTPQSASLIAAGVTLDPFCREYGAYANAQESLSKDLSRTAVKQQIVRLRSALGSAFCEAGLSLDPRRIVISQETEMNEVRYVLKASVEWRHIEY